jgi:hypothetical protein
MVSCVAIFAIVLEALDHHRGRCSDAQCVGSARSAPWPKEGEAPAERRCGKVKTRDLEGELLKLDEDDLARMCALFRN